MVKNTADQLVVKEVEQTDFYSIDLIAANCGSNIT